MFSTTCSHTSSVLGQSLDCIVDSLQYLRGVIHSLTLALVDDSAFSFLNSGALNIVHSFANLLLHNIALFLIGRVTFLQIELD